MDDDNDDERGVKAIFSSGTFFSPSPLSVLLSESWVNKPLMQDVVVLSDHQIDHK